MMVGMECGACIVCGKQAYTFIAGKAYCYEHGKEHISEAVDVGMANAMKQHGGEGK